MPRTVATVFADASFCHRTKASAYAVWIKANGATIRHAGPFKRRIANSGIAETLALANGIWLAMSRLDMQPGDMIVAQSDCQGAIGTIGGTQKPAKGLGNATAKVRAEIKRRGVVLRLKHVKGHKGNATPRNAVNTWCDSAAQQVMRTERAAARHAESQAGT